MAVPAYCDDGDFTIAQENGNPVYNFPFTARGDFSSFTAKVTKRIDWRYYEKPISMTQREFEDLGKAYLVDYNPPTGVGQGLLEWVEIYASVPQTGVERGNASYTVQIPTINSYGIDSTIASYVDTFDAKYVYEYSLFKPLPQILYTRLQLIPKEANGGALTVCVVGSSLEVGNAQNVLAQNTTSKIYMGEIFERLSIFISPSFPRILQEVIPPPP